MIPLMIALIQCLVGLVSGAVASMELASTYRFGEVGNLELFCGESSGFIEVSFDGKTLSIDLVRRPTDWPAGSKFCSFMLPAVVDHFLSTVLAIPIAEVQRLVAINMATNPGVACKCYVGLMVNMGFAIVNGKIVDSHSDVCNRDSMSEKMISGRPPLTTAGVLPQVDPAASELLKGASINTRTRFVGGDG